MNITINGQNLKFLSIGSTVFHADDDLIQGYDVDGNKWYQLNLETVEMDEPYLKQHGYYITEKECEQSGNNIKLEFYKWCYRCLRDNFAIPKRLIFHHGKLDSISVFSTSDDGHGYLEIPYSHFGDLGDGLRKSEIASVVQYDNYFIASITGTSNLEPRLLAEFPNSEEELQQMQTTMENTIGIIDAKIYELYGFSSDNKPQTVEDKVKVAKVIYDWLIVNNTYNNKDEDGWLDHTPYSALSNGDTTPVCDSYAQAAQLMLTRYGINSVRCVGMASPNSTELHAWLMVNYHDEIGIYTEDENVWCGFDCTGYRTGNHKGWEDFNFANKDDYYNQWNTHNPCLIPRDAEHTYSGSKHYEW